MPRFALKENCLGFELHDEGRLVALYRAHEALDPVESPKPCFAPIFTPSGTLVTEYRPRDHTWHTGLYFGWVHANESNLWGGPWYIPESGKYEYIPDTWGRQAHESFETLQASGDTAKVVERLTWRDFNDTVMAEETRTVEFSGLEGAPGSFWRVAVEIRPVVERLTIASSKAARYSGFELRMGPPFADAAHRTSEGVKGHEAIMGSHARWCCAVGATGGAVVMLDHPANPRHPTPWFTRKNLMGAALLMEEEMQIPKGESLELRYGFAVLDEDPSDAFVERLYLEFSHGAA